MGVMGLLLWLQVKRIHEYKRQLLNVLGIIWKYDQIKKMSPDQRSQVPLLHPNLMFLSSGTKISAYFPSWLPGVACTGCGLRHESQRRWCHACV